MCLAQITLGFFPDIIPSPAQVLETSQLTCSWIIHHKFQGKSEEVTEDNEHLLSALLFMSNFLLPHELQHARIPCTSPTPRACPNSCSLSWQCHPTISTSAIPFSSCLQSFPASGSFPRVSSSHQVAKVLKLQLQYQSFQ